MKVIVKYKNKKVYKFDNIKECVYLDNSNVYEFYSDTKDIIIAREDIKEIIIEYERKKR